jgi:hypothetical protein
MMDHDGLRGGFDYMNWISNLIARLIAGLLAHAAWLLGITLGALTLLWVVNGILSDAVSLFSVIGWEGLLSLPLFALGGSLIAEYLRATAAERRQRRVVVGVALVMVSASIVAPRLIEGMSANTRNQSNSSSIPLPPQTTNLVPNGVPVDPLGPCPKPDPTDPRLPSAEVRVVYWCKGSVLAADGTLDKSQVQIKLRPRILNNTSEVIDTSISNPSAIRLLVTGKQVDVRWRAPQKTARAGDRPSIVECNGGTFWAIPPNVPGDAKVVAGPDGIRSYDGFATIWGGVDSVGAGQSLYFPLRRNLTGSVIQEGDLVFQLPVEDDGSIRIYGLALVERRAGGSVLGLARFGEPAEWGERVDPTSF